MFRNSLALKLAAYGGIVVLLVSAVATLIEASMASGGVPDQTARRASPGLTWQIVTVELAKVLLISGLLFLIARSLVGAPLRALAEGIATSAGDGARAITSSVSAVNRANELGEVAAAAASIQSAQAARLGDRDTTIASLRDDADKLSDYLRAGSDWFWEQDQDRKMTFLSDEFFEQSGWTPEDIIGKVSQTYVADTGADTVDQDWIDIGEALAERRPFRDFRFLIKHANGDLHHMSSSGVPVFDAEGAYQGYRGIATDRTELVESEKERQRLADDLNQAQKLRAIGQLTGGVAHDFNNLLAVVMGNLELAEEHRPEEAIAERIRYAKEATERGAALTHRLLAYARQQPLAPQPIDAAEIISGLDDLLRRTLGEKVEIEFVINAGTWRCMADQQQLETAILNLAVNARDAMPNGGKLTIEAFNSRLDAEYAEQGPEITPGQYVCFAVTDTGTGMSPDVVDQAFDPFFTTKEAGQGSGLGLSMAFGFVKQSNGHIKIYSEEDSGTTVKIYLPRTEGSVTGDPRRSTTADSTVLTGRKVLVVEDELEVRNVVVAQLERFGCVVQAAATSEQAIELCEKDADFELLLVDVVLPGPLDGRELSIALGTLVPGAKIVFMSGYTENSIVHNGKLDEGVLLLQKPFSRADLVAMLIRALRNGQ